jgi:PAS domain S-box-containing protein
MADAPFPGAATRQIFAWIDKFNPADLPPSSLLRARLVTTFTLAVEFWIPIFTVTAVTFMDAPWTGLTIGGFGLSMLAAPLAMRRWGLWAGGNVAAGSIFATVFTTSVINGGPMLHTHMTLSVVPVLGASLAGVRSAAGWTALVLLSTVGLFVLEVQGVSFPRDMPLEHQWLFQVMSACALSVILMCFVMLYEYTRDEVTSALRAREEDLAAIVDTAPDGLLVIGEQGHLRRVNPAAERLFGAPAATLLGSSIDLLFPGGLQLRDGVTLTDVPSRRADGTPFPADVAIGQLALGEHARYVTIIRDVGGRHEAERAIAEARDRAVQASRAKSTFLANMSHELRTPLNAILGYAELIGEEFEVGDPVNAQQDVARIVAAGRHLLSLIDDVLDLSKIEAGKLTLERHVVQLDELVESVISTIRPLAGARVNTLLVEIAQPLGCITSDPVRLRQVLLNLLSNASKFTDRGSITLRAWRTPEEPDRPERIRFEIADTGIGMSREQVERIFEDFVQGDTSTTRRFGGTGLGLAISRRIARMMGGDLTVWSEVGVGSTFSFEVPTLPVMIRGTPGPAPVRGGVLAIEADPWVRGNLARMLRRTGLTVSLAGQPAEGLELAAHLQPYAVVLEVLTPYSEAWETLRRLREEPTTRDLAVVLHMSADQGLALILGNGRVAEHPHEGTRFAEAVRSVLPASTGHALLAEDNLALGEVVARGLARAGWSVAQAKDAEEGLRSLERQRPDVIILDLLLPNLGEVALLETLREGGAYRDVPVLVISGQEIGLGDIDRLRVRLERLQKRGEPVREQLLGEVLSIARRPLTPQNAERAW